MSLLGQNDELRPPVMRVGPERDQPLPFQIVDDPLNVLAVRAHIAGKPSHRLRTLRRDDAAQNLPAGTGEPSSATSRSPEASIRLLSLNRSRMRPVKAVPAGVRLV